MMNLNRIDKCRFRKVVSLALALTTGSSFAAPPAKKVFELNCIACHQIDNTKQPVVGPSLVEIADLYKKDVSGFIKWCNSPGKKRKGAIQMPSMAHVGNKNLRAIHIWMLDVTKGKKFVPKKKKKVDPYAYSKNRVSGPRLQRIFMADSSPASIAVTIDGQHSLCWDTVSCRMRYLWKGGFIDGYPYWAKNGNAFAQLVGEVYYRAPKDLSSSLINDELKSLPKFKGYKMVNGLPIVTYQLGAYEVREAILNKKGGVVIQVKIKSEEAMKGVVRYPLGDLTKTSLQYSVGKIEGGDLILTAAEAKSFSLTFNLKK